MSTFSAEEIAEKRRLAQEKLRAKKEQLSTKNVDTTAAKTPNALKVISQNNKQSNKTLSNNNHIERSTSATEFLNALKQNNLFPQLNNIEVNSNTNQKRPSMPSNDSPPPRKIAPVFQNTICCKVYMISPTRFAVQPSAFHTKLIDIFKTIPSRSYDNKTRIWNFLLKDYQLLQKNVSVLKPEVVMGNIPKNVIELCLKPQKSIDRVCLASIENTLASKLMPFQEEGVCFAIAQSGRVMICDEMGLGKTFQALAVADYFRDDWPLLIATTASMRETWSNHIRELLPSVPMHYVQTLTNNQQYVGDAKIIITSFQMLEKHFSKLLELHFGFLIFDESHILKNSKAKCTTYADKLASYAKHIILLSGTPALSRPVELFSQLQMIDRRFMGYKDFTSRYCDGKQTHFGWDANGQSNLEELNVILKLKYMVRRTKADVLPEIGEKSRETITLDPALIWTNQETKEAIFNFTENLSKHKGREREEILIKFYARTAEVKAPAVCAYLKTLLKDKTKFIVFAHHLVLINAICDLLRRQDVNFIRIDGSTKSEQRANAIATFQRDPNCKVAVLSLKACNAGITLTSADLIVFAELDWNPSTLAQAESRVHRIGQSKPVTCRYLLAEKTADDVIWSMLKNKQDVLNKAGIFCEDLQETTHSTAPTTSTKIQDYFSPIKIAPNTSATKTSTEFNKNKPLEPSDKLIAQTIKTNANQEDIGKNLVLAKDLGNIDEFFNDDENDAFINLAF